MQVRRHANRLQTSPGLFSKLQRGSLQYGGAPCSIQEAYSGQRPAGVAPCLLPAAIMANHAYSHFCAPHTTCALCTPAVLC